MKEYDSNEQYDVIVVGAGHAGCEAGLAAARMGQKVLLLTISLDMVAFMPCNPSIGGPAKGVVVREIDALGGEMAKNIDKTYVQMRMLNTGKGPAVQALRAQADKYAYHAAMKKTLENEKNITLRQAVVNRLIIKDRSVIGVVTNTGARYHSKAVILAMGTSSRGKIFIGELNYSSGPNNTLPSIQLSKNLENIGFKIKRFKTGTPPRVNAHSIDYDEMIEQKGDEENHSFSYETDSKNYIPVNKQLSCWMTFTNEKTHQIIRDNLDRAPLFSGDIKGVGPRYCPSLEDKIVRFADKPRHQIFLEPEGRDTDEMYVGEFSTSLPEEIQQKMLHSVKGFHHAEMMRPGYAIEYDIIEPWQLKKTLETKLINNLYTAGQINGTSGYEEAAGQGIIAGINAALKIKNKKPLILKRSDAYIGVMIDDLVTKGTNEPYRLLTSRAEYRLLLRSDNADLRLTEIGHSLGLIGDDRYIRYKNKLKLIQSEISRLQSIRIKPSSSLKKYLKSKGYLPLKDGILASDFLKRPGIKYNDLLLFIPSSDHFLDKQTINQVEIQIKYEGYIKKQQQNVEKLKRLESKKIPENIDYEKIPNLATEARQKLKKISPTTIAQASRISGVNPSDIAILSVYIQEGKIAKI